MARVTVEDCIDKVENRFDLVLLGKPPRAHDLVRHPDHRRARQRQEPGRGVARDRRRGGIARGPQGRARPLAAESTSRSTSRSPRRVPLIGAPGTGVDADDTDVTTDRMSEEELLKGLEGLTPPESQPEPEARHRRRGRISFVTIGADATDSPVNGGFSLVMPALFRASTSWGRRIKHVDGRDIGKEVPPFFERLCPPRRNEGRGARRGYFAAAYISATYSQLTRLSTNALR